MATVSKASLAEDVEVGNKCAISHWIAKGANVNETDEYGYTPLLSACVNESFECVKELLKYKADVNKRGQFGYTPLHAAAQNGSLQIIMLLLSHKAQPNVRDEDGNTPLTLALRGNHAEVADVLIKNGANIHLTNQRNNVIETLISLKKFDWADCILEKELARCCADYDDHVNLVKMVAEARKAV